MGPTSVISIVIVSAIFIAGIAGALAFMDLGNDDGIDMNSSKKDKKLNKKSGSSGHAKDTNKKSDKPSIMAIIAGFFQINSQNNIFNSNTAIFSTTDNTLIVFCDLCGGKIDDEGYHDDGSLNCPESVCENCHEILDSEGLHEDGLYECSVNLCDNCGEELDSEGLHANGSLDCDKEANVCDNCGEELDEEGLHVNGSLDCEEETEANTCDDCNQEVDDMGNHEDGLFGCPENICDSCGERLDMNNYHEDGSLDCEDEPTMCDLCGEELDDQGRHADGSLDCEEDTSVDSFDDYDDDGYYYLTLPSFFAVKT